MGRGFMRQSVHPMNSSELEDGRRHPDDNDSQELATDTSSDFVTAESKGLGERGMADDKERGPSMPTDAHRPKPPPLVSMNSHTKVNGATGVHGRDYDVDEDGAAEVLPLPAGAGMKAASTRVLTFADETGGVLVEMNYSNRTHYSKQATPGVVQGANRACCVIQ